LNPSAKQLLILLRGVRNPPYFRIDTPYFKQELSMMNFELGFEKWTRREILREAGTPLFITAYHFLIVIQVGAFKGDRLLRKQLIQNKLSYSKSAEKV